MADINPIDTTPVAGIDAAPDQSAADRGRVKDLAEQFESMLVSQMLREMRRGIRS